MISLDKEGALPFPDLDKMVNKDVSGKLIPLYEFTETLVMNSNQVK